jgi:hypothetical protein
MRITLRFLPIVAALAAGFVQLASAKDAPMKSEVLSAYVKIADALAADDLAAAQASATALAGSAGISDQFQIAKQATAVAKAADLAAAREGFKVLSTSIEPLAASKKGYVVMTCTMANADWVQTSSEVKNPYLGKAMLNCGEPKKADATPGHGRGEPSPGQGHTGHAQHGCN